MIRYLLDTSVLAGVLFSKPPIVDRLAFPIARGLAAPSLLVYGETMERLLGRYDFETRKRALRGLLEQVPALPLRPEHAERYAALRRTLRPPYGPGLIGDIDTLIAATAIEHGLTLVTMDRDFERVPGLALLLVPRR